MLRAIILITSLISVCLLTFLLVTTTPLTVGPFGILIVFISAYLLLAGLVTFFISGVSRIFARLSRIFVFRKPIESLTLKQSYYYSTIIAAAPIMLIGLQSVGAISIYEYLLIILFTIIGCIYVSKRAG
jgi:hypothetical protein